MEILLFVLMLAILAYVSYRNFKLIGRFSSDRKYIETYRSVLDQEETAYEKVCEYIGTEKSLDLKNKGLLLKLYLELEKDTDYSNTLSLINLKDVFYKNNVFSNNQLSNNVDAFVWINIIMAVARKKSKFEVLNTIMDQLNEIEELDNRVEYQLSKSIYNCLNEKEDGGVGFMADLLEGNYTNYQYDKKLIALYKRFASSSLAYSGEPMEEYYKVDLADFSKSQIGYVYMNALDIYNKYHIEETSEQA